MKRSADGANGAPTAASLPLIPEIPAPGVSEGVAPDRMAMTGTTGTVEGTGTAAGAVTSGHRVAYLRALEQRVLTLVQHKRRQRDVNQLYDESLTTGQRVADAVAATMGSWPFIITQSVLLAVWIVFNVSEVLWRAWDPYPFILLNLMLSLQAAYAAPIIMMSQNRQAAKDRLQAELDLNTDLKAEALIEELHGSVDDMRLRQWQELLLIQQHQIELLTNLIERQGGTAQVGSPAET